MSDKVTGSGLRICTQQSSTKFISDALGIDNTAGHLKGDPRSGKGTAGTFAESMWILDSPLGESADLSSHIEFILNLLESRASQWASVRHLTESADISCMCSSENGQVSELLKAGLIERLARQNLDLLLDLYPPEA